MGSFIKKHIKTDKIHSHRKPSKGERKGWSHSKNYTFIAISSLKLEGEVLQPEHACKYLEKKLVP